MASIVERGGKFYARVRRDGWKPVAKTFTLKRDAIAWGRRVEADMESGRWVEVGNTVPTLAEAVKLYRAGPVAGLKGAVTYGYWLDELEASSLGAKRLHTITAPDLAAWRDAQAAAGLVPGTVVRKLGLLSGFFTWCWRERGWLTCNPLRCVTKPKVNDARDRVLTDEELRALQGAARSSRAAWIGDALTVLVRSAMRRGELWGLKVADVDFEQSTCHLADTKNGSARDVPLCPEAREALQRLAVAAQARDAAAAVRRAKLRIVRDGKASRDGDTAHADTGLKLIPLTDPHAISLAFRRTVARARALYLKACAVSGDRPDPSFLADLHLHDLRHQAVSHWAATGALTMPELMAVSGHKTPRMLTRYAHLKASALASKLAQLTPPSSTAEAPSAHA